MKKILFQLDTDPLPSTFDRVVAVDSGVDEVFSYGGVTPENVEPLVHGGMFTRGPKHLKSTAVFIGGSQAAAGQVLLERVMKVFFGPMRLSVMMDSNGSNTTAAAAVLAARKHMELKGVHALVAGGTGPVGQRVAQLLARAGAHVNLGSRTLDRARKTCDDIKQQIPNARLTPCEVQTEVGKRIAVGKVSLIIAAGAAGAELMSKEDLKLAGDLKVAIDLNAVPPPGLAGVEITDNAAKRNGILCYGAIGIGGMKMKIHKAALKSLFESNDRVLDTEAIFAIGETLAE
jgi:methylenetetrahydrofolate/methylenetetrahydromethanopterin dehydrogenase (NADP+)